MSFPWTVILKQAPVLISAAEGLLASSRRNAAAAAAAAASDVQTLRQRVEQIAAHQEANAEVVAQLTEQVGALAQAAQAGAERLRLAVLLAGGGLALGAAACVIAVLW